MAQPFLTASLQRGLLAEPFLEQSGLSLSDIQAGEAGMSGQHWYDLVEAVARAIGHPNLGYEIGTQAALEELPNLRTILCAQGMTLSEILMTLILDASRVTSTATYRIETDDHVTRVFATRTFYPSSPPAQADGYFIGFMVRLVSACCGREWYPELFKARICKPEVVPREVRECIKLQRGDRRGSVYEFPSRWMLLRFGQEQEQDFPIAPDIGPGLLEQTRKILELHLDKPSLTLEAFANLTSQGSSNLKRKFREHGTTFRKELNRCRRARAEALLTQSDLAVKAISEKVGFSDVPSFSRSFKGWTGLPPGEYRKRRSNLRKGRLGIA